MEITNNTKTIVKVTTEYDDGTTTVINGGETAKKVQETITSTKQLLIDDIVDVSTNNILLNE